MAEAGRFETTITSDGINDVTIEFDLQTGTWFVMNSFAMEAVTETISITVIGGNDAPILVPDTNTITETVDAIADPEVTGNVLSNDGDADGDTLTVANPGTIAGAYGSLELGSDGSYTYTLDDANVAVDGLNVGDTLTDSFTYIVSDNDASWDFTGGSTAPSAQGATFTASEITQGLGIGSFNSNADLGYPTQPVVQINPAGTSSKNIDEAVATDTYFEFTLTPDSILDLNSLSFDVAKGGGGTRGWGLRSSIDGFASNIDTADAPLVRSFTNVTVDLSGSEFQNLTEAVTFRIYLYAPASGNSVEFDNIVIDAAPVESTLEITINGANDSPNLSDDTNSVSETADAVSNPQATGNVLTDPTADSDVDSPTLTVTNAGTTVGEYGTLVLNSNGGYTYTLDDSNPVVDALADGENLTDSFVYEVNDGDAAPSDSAVWDFTGGSSGASTPGSDFTASPITSGAGLGTFNPNATDGYPSDPVLHVNPPNGSTNVDQAVAANSYFEFTVTPDEYTSLQDLTFDVARGGGTTPRGWAVRSSIDGFTTNIDTADVTTARPNLTNISVDLSGDEFQLLSSAVKFRVYIYAPSGGNSLEFDNITLNTTTPHAAKLDITIDGTNDTPVVAATAATNLNETTDTSDITGNVTVSFTDVDLTDTGHVTTITAATTSGSDTGLSLDEAALRNLIAVNSMTKLSGSDSGSANLTFTASSTDFDYLAAGETVTITYTASVSDGDVGGTNTFDVVITGTNDAPTVSATADANLNETTDTTDITGNVTVNFTDVDLTDIGHTATITAATTSGVVAGLILDESALRDLINVVSTTKNSGSGSGSAALAFTASSTDFDYLAAGETVTITYTVSVSDGDVAATNTFNVVITGTNDAPVITQSPGPVTVIMDEDGSPTAFVAPTIGATDVDISDTLIWTLASPASNGAATVSGTGATPTISYAPTTHYNGDDSFDIQVSDGKGGVKTITVEVTINPIDDATVFGGDTSGSGVQNESLAGTLTADDPDGLTNPDFTITTDPAHGTASIDLVTGEWSYTPDTDYFGPDSFTVRIQDDAGNFAFRDITFTVGDAILPVPEITGPDSATKDEPFEIEIDFGEEVTGFDRSDISVSGGAVTGLVDLGDGYYIAQITPQKDGVLTISIAAGSANDLAGNANTAGSFTVPVELGVGNPSGLYNSAVVGSDSRSVSVALGAFNPGEQGGIFDPSRENPPMRIVLNNAGSGFFTGSRPQLRINFAGDMVESAIYDLITSDDGDSFMVSISLGDFGRVESLTLMGIDEDGNAFESNFVINFALGELSEDPIELVEVLTN